MRVEHRTQQLALQGGMKAVSSIEGKGRPKIGVGEFMSVCERFGLSKSALRSIRRVAEAEDWGSGPFLANYYSGLAESKVEAFERTARELFGSPYAIGVSSGTGALHCAFVAAGVGPGKEVICPAIGFVATAAAVVQAGGVPVFCDVDASLGMDPAKIEERITPRTVALAPTHVMGSVCDMRGIMRAARKHRLRVVEDCAQSCGGRFRGRYVGTIGDLGCFSISAYKIVGGGEGGLLLARSKRLWERASQVAETGGLWRPVRFAAPRYAGELFCGSNYRMSELEAAVDVVQMNRLEESVRRFRAVKRRIVSKLKTYREIVPQRLNDADGEVGYRLAFFPESLALGRRIVEALKAEGVAAGMRGSGGAPDWHVYGHMQPLLAGGLPDGRNCSLNCPHYREAGGRFSVRHGGCPVADDLFERTVMIGLNQWYTARDCAGIARGINKVLNAYCTPDCGASPWLPPAAGKSA